MVLFVVTLTLNFIALRSSSGTAKPMSERSASARQAAIAARLNKRYAVERRFRRVGLGAIVLSALVLAFCCCR
jgi:hypothetical protein